MGRPGVSFQSCQQHMGTGRRNNTRNTAPHADSRGLVFADDFLLLEIDDGGLYRLYNPQAAVGVSETSPVWVSDNRGLRILEAGYLGYDILNNIIFSGNQDNGSTQQTSINSLNWSIIHVGDGFQQASAVVDLPPAGGTLDVVRYSLANNFDFIYFAGYTNAGAVVIPTARVDLAAAATPGVRLSGLTNPLDSPNPPNSLGVTEIPIAVNRFNNNRVLIGKFGLYESTNRLATINRIDTDGPVAKLADGSFPLWQGIGAIAYGGRSGGVNNADVLIYSRGNSLMFRDNPANPFGVNKLPGAGYILDIALDPDNWKTVYVIDNKNNVYRIDDITDVGTAWVRITGNLATLGQKNELSGIAFANNGVNDVLLVSGTRRGSQVI